MAIYNNIKCCHLQCPKKVPRAFFVVAYITGIATNPGEKAIRKTWFYLFIYLLCHHTYTFIGWETTTAIANYSGPKILEI
jgi:hypothetical protein